MTTLQALLLASIGVTIAIGTAIGLHQSAAIRNMVLGERPPGSVTANTGIGGNGGTTEDAAIAANFGQVAVFTGQGTPCKVGRAGVTPKNIPQVQTMLRDLINNDRVKLATPRGGAPRLALADDPKLDAQAAADIQDMATNNYVSTVNLQGLPIQQRLQQNGVSIKAASELIFKGCLSNNEAGDISNLWITDQTANAVLSNSVWNHLGIAIRADPKVPAGSGYYWVAIFAWE